MFNGFNDMYEDFYNIKPDNSVSSNETGFLQMLDQLDTGLNLFKGNTDSLASWQMKILDSNGEVTNGNCN